MHTHPQRFSFQAMGSYCDIQLGNVSRIEAKRIAGLLREEVIRLEQKYSRFRSDSVISAINASAGAQQGIEIDAETQALLDHAASCFSSSGGLFDVTAAALNEVWDFKKATVPSREQIDGALAHVGFERLRRDGPRLYLAPGMRLDFGGIVKEYAADSACRLARSIGVRHGLINLGGDYSVIGPQPDQTPWTVAIVSPESQDGIMATIELMDGGLASSGDYERFFEHDGKRYSHILNPSTGWPSSGMRAVSVAANLCTVAGSVATIAMLEDDTGARRWLRDSGFPHVYMDSGGHVGRGGFE